MLSTSRKGGRPILLCWVFISLTFATALSLSFAAWAGTPEISLIEPFINQQVLIHFDTEADRTYILQYSSSLSATSHWSNLFTAFAYPFANHYIVVDTRSAPQRFYRLAVTP